MPLPVCTQDHSLRLKSGYAQDGAERATLSDIAVSHRAFLEVIEKSQGGLLAPIGARSVGG